MNTYPYQIFVNALRISIRLGCRPEERKNSQAAQLDVLFDVSLNSEASDPDQTVCYLSASILAQELANSREWSLIENYLEALTTEYFKRFPSCIKVESSLTKFVVPACLGAGVRITRQRSRI